MQAPKGKLKWTTIVPRPNIFQVVDGGDRALTLPTQQDTMIVSMARKVAEHDALLRGLVDTVGSSNQAEAKEVAAAYVRTARCEDARGCVARISAVCEVHDSTTAHSVWK